MWLAEMETEHFTFQALGETHDGARDALGRGWRAHGAQYGADAVVTPWAEAQHYYGVNVTQIAPGQCLRDGSVIA